MSDNNERLYSLDVLRGLDMILLTVVGPLVVAVQSGWKCFPDGFMAQFDHAWGGFTLWDIIMPLFIFMCGAAVPFALKKRLDADGRSTPAFWKHVFARFALLWFLGLLVQGQLMTFNPLRIHPYCNTLQSIAAGYLIAAMALLIPSLKGRIALPIVLTAVYGLLMHFCGDYTREGNVAAIVEKAVYGPLVPAGNRTLEIPGGYTWVLTTLMFGVLTLAGMLSTEILRSCLGPWARAGLLAGSGAGCLAVGWLLVLRVPMIKQLFTVSFSLQAIGWCMLALAALYVINDIGRFRFGLRPVVFFGQSALAAYFISHFFEPVLKAGAHVLGDGLCTHLPSSAVPLVLQLIMTAELVFAMICWRRVKSRRGAMAV